ncbi:MAG: mercury(II) reductase [Gemmatimonadota bacterium]|nr:mercury(II) reductase [Gemmatimonadota bacterium]
MEAKRYQLAIVGGGSAGFAAAIRAAESGAGVVMVNSGTIGGTCVNVGCVPSKTLIRAAEARHRAGFHPFAGIGHHQPAVDWPAVRAAKDDLVTELRTAKYEEVLAAHPGIDFISARASLLPHGGLELEDGRSIRARSVIITTGSSPWVPDVPGLREAGFVDSTGLLEMEALPDSLAVLGAGSVGLELAQAFARLGVEVTVLARSRLLSSHDPALGSELARHLEAEGLRIRTGVQVASIESAPHGRRIRFASGAGDEEMLDVAKILLASGRRANTAGLGLKAAGVKLGPHGEILVDASCRTSSPRIFAAGDVTGGPMHVYVAAKAGQVAADAALGLPELLDLSILPRVTFTDPAVAAVGLTEDEARATGHEPVSTTLPLDKVPRALAARDTRGFVKLIADGPTRRLLGAHILAPEAGEMIMEPALAVRTGMTIEDLASMFHPYLTHAEGIKLAALAFDKDVAKLSCCAA